jgi:hypothetical protein
VRGALGQMDAGLHSCRQPECSQLSASQNAPSGSCAVAVDSRVR